MPTPIIQDGSLSEQIPNIPAFRPVAAQVFSERAERFAAISQGHPLGPYLRFAGSLCAAQAAVLRQCPEVPLPDETTLANCREHGLPPLSVDGHRRDPLWRRALAQLSSGLNTAAFTTQIAAAIERVGRRNEGQLEAAAASVLAGAYSELDLGEAPFIAAALQVYFTKMALQLGERAAGLAAHSGQCPVCGSYPIASVVRVGGAQQGLRYLVCSLCASEWHLVRIKCSTCGSTKGISYLAIEGAGEAVKAECCDQCKTYLKIFYLEKDSAMVPAADDLAWLALDLLVAEQGYNRIGPNLLLLPGSSA